MKRKLFTVKYRKYHKYQKLSYSFVPEFDRIIMEKPSPSYAGIKQQIFGMYNARCTPDLCNCFLHSFKIKDPKKFTRFNNDESMVLLDGFVRAVAYELDGSEKDDFTFHDIRSMARNYEDREISFKDANFFDK